MKASLPQALQQAVDARLSEAEAQRWVPRLYDGDASLWTSKDEGKWLGWIPAARGEQVDFAQLDAIRALGAKCTAVVLLGMGGSSLGPEVLGRMLGGGSGRPTLHVLDTTDPGQIGAVADAIDPKTTLFIVSSKSGSTMEPELLRAFFWERSGRDGARWIAVTDPGSDLEKAATADSFAQIAHGDPAIGGRYSVLSAFGMVPAAAIGLDVRALYDRTKPMLAACAPEAPAADNPGLRLGLVLGEAVKAGRDKLTILPSPGMKPFGAWLEQLLAESTGKQGTGIVPVDLEPAGEPGVYGDDRLFAHLHLEGDHDEALHAKLKALREAGQPVVSIHVASKQDVGAEFFRWEVATAISGVVMGIDVFDQPDVEDAKVATRKLVDAYEKSGEQEQEQEQETAAAETGDFAIFLPEGASAAGDAAGLLAAHFATLKAGDYAGFLAYVERDDADEALVERARVAVRTARRVATVAGFGPRFLHSTGQAYKGGPKDGAFLVITRDADPDLAIPGKKASFGTVQVMQARGDMEVLAKRGQRVIRAHLKLGGGGLKALVAAVEAAVRG